MLLHAVVGRYDVDKTLDDADFIKCPVRQYGIAYPRPFHFPCYHRVDGVLPVPYPCVVAAGVSGKRYDCQPEVKTGTGRS